MANIIDSLKLGDIHGIIALPYGTCSTAAATAAKIVSLTNFVLETGASVRIKFSNANSASTPTLNVNSTGAKNIRWNNANLPSTQYWTANQVIDFVYDGSYWQMIGAAKDNNTDTKVKCTSLKTVTSGTETLYPVLMCSTASPTSGTAYEAKYNTGVKISNYGVLMGAAWNDYAEYRNQEEEIEPGYCVKSADNGKVSKTTEKYAACDGIVSDTFGFSIGKTDACQTPLAVAGRVLAYFEGNREDYQAGDTVCAGPNGKVMKMTREEIKEYPDRIIGLVSEIPEYETWGEGNISVNKRIWIKIK